MRTVQSVHRRVIAMGVLKRRSGDRAGINLVLPVQMVRQTLRKTVGAIIPLPVKAQEATAELEDESDLTNARRPSRKLCEAASFVKVIRASALAPAQFLDVLTDRKGKITRPTTWRAEAIE